ncbi:class I SAM-dependent methyltransferase [Mycolicibacterium sp. 3033]|nr:class I SAM-dependent methyltransferase [Mycolicibacterium aurantiacum]
MRRAVDGSYLRPVNQAWLRAMALLYDPFLWLGEVGGMGRRRRALLAGASGRVLEIGAGTGLNLPCYPRTLDELILAEPEPGMRGRLERRLRRLGRVARIIDVPAEGLGLPDASVDTVVSTLVLCTVAEPERALREIARVLTPGGRLLFIEHVRARSRWLAACQRLLRRPWRAFAGGCVCDRDTLEIVAGCGLAAEFERASWLGMPAIVGPLVVGRAHHAAGGLR